MTSSSEQKINYLFPGIIIITAILLFLPSINIPFINDEIAFIKRNNVEDISGLAGLFDKKDYDGDYYRPAGNFLSGLLTMAGDYSSVFYRIFNILLHTLNGILIYIFVLRLLKENERKEITALFAALFFIAFPLNDYAVIWHTDLFDRIMTSFYLSSLIFFLNKSRWNGVSLLFFLLAILSKEMAFSLPFVIFLFSYFINDTNKLKNAAKDVIPYLIVLLILIAFRWFVFGNNIFDLQDAHSSGTTLDAGKNIIKFLGMLLFPFFLREVQELLLSGSAVFYLTAGIAALVIIYYLIKRRRKDFLFWILLLFVIIMIIPSSRLLMRWYMYLPSAAFCMLISYLIFNRKVKIKNALITAVIIFGLYYSGMLYREMLWIDVSKAGEESLLELKSYRNFNNDEMIFLTVPAKVNDIPLFQLGFDHHIRQVLGLTNNVNVLSKSALDAMNDKIDINIADGTILLQQNGDNYFILSDIDKSIKFNGQDFKEGKLKRIIYTKNYKEPDRTIFTFSEGKFHIIKE